MKKESQGTTMQTQESNEKIVPCILSNSMTGLPVKELKPNIYYQCSNCKFELFTNLDLFVHSGEKEEDSVSQMMTPKIHRQRGKRNQNETASDRSCSVIS